MRTETHTLSRLEHTLLDRAVRLLSDSLDRDSEATEAQKRATLGLWRKLNECCVVQCHEVVMPDRDWEVPGA